MGSSNISFPRNLDSTKYRQQNESDERIEYGCIVNGMVYRFQGTLIAFVLNSDNLVSV